MDDVARRHQHADFGVDGNDERIVDLEKIVLALGFAVFDLRERRSEIRIETEALLQVIVAPFPLVSGDFDRHVGRRRVVHREHGLRRRIGHEQQDQKRNDRPDDLD